MGRREAQRSLAFWFASFVALAPALAHADPPTAPVAAEALFRAGREAFKRGDFVSSCSRFAESQRLDPAAGTALNLSECEERLGRTASAWQHLRTAIDLLQPTDDRLPAARERVLRLEALVPRLVVSLAQGAPPETAIVLDDVELGAASRGLAQPVDPGDHVIRVRAPGRRTATYRAHTEAGRTTKLEVAPGEPEPTGAGAQAVPFRGGSQRTLGYILLGAGAASFGASVLTAVMMVDTSDERAQLCSAPCALGSPERRDALDLNGEGKTLALVSSLAFGVGALAVVSGVYFVITSKTPRSSAGSVVATF